MNPQIIQILNQYIAKGYSLSQIKAYLLQQYPEIEVDEAIDYYAKSWSKQIDPYVQQFINAKYSEDAIKQAFSQRGYDPIVIEKSLSKFFPRYDPPSLLHSGRPVKTVLFAVFFLIISSAVVGLLFLGGQGGSPSKLMDVEARALDRNEEFRPGEMLRFEVDGLNMGDKEPYDVTFHFRLFGRDKVTIEEKSVTKALATSINFVEEIRLPGSLESGKYYLEASADYQDGIATSQFSIAVDNERTEKGQPPGQVNRDDQDDDDSSIADPDDDSGQGDDLDSIADTAQDPVADDGMPEIEEGGMVISSDSAFGAYISRSAFIDNVSTLNPDFARFVCRSMPLDGSQQECLAKIEADLPSCNATVMYSGQRFCVSDESFSRTNKTICESVPSGDAREQCERTSLEYEGITEMILDELDMAINESTTPLVVDKEFNETTINDYE